jgi:hypothetical protein
MIDRSISSHASQSAYIVDNPTVGIIDKSTTVLALCTQNCNHAVWIHVSLAQFGMLAKHGSSSIVYRQIIMSLTQTIMHLPTV